jgi:hypothetical protein
MASAGLLAALLVWVLAPVLFFFALLVAALGIASAGMIWLARRLQTWRDRRPR